MSKRVREDISQLELVVIDEISMLGACQGELFNYQCQQAKGNKLPFGGIRTVVSGDFISFHR